jgi:hypothetical protein
MKFGFAGREFRRAGWPSRGSIRVLKAAFRIILVVTRTRVQPREWFRTLGIFHRSFDL